MKTGKIALIGWALLLGVFCTASVFGQKIFIDKPVTAGELTLFPSVDDGNLYYYLPDKVRLATHENGKPQMLFMKFVDNVKSEAGDEDVREADGGGIFHAVVTFDVGEVLVEVAEKALKKINPEASILGPVIYKSGTVALISAVADEKGGHVKRIVGLGNAPLLEGQKAAIAFLLDKQGAKLLWNTFQTPTPDVSFSFEMEVGGYLSPIKGWMKGSFDQIYESHDFKVGGKFTYPPGVLTFGAEVGATFDKLRRDGVIEVYSEGGDENFDKLLAIAYNKLADQIFEPVSKSLNSIVAANNARNRDYDKLQKSVDALMKKGEKKTKADEKATDKTKKTDATEQKKDEKKKVEEKKKTGNNNGSGLLSAQLALVDYLKSFIPKVPSAEINERLMPSIEAGASGMFAITAAYQYTRRKQSGSFFINFDKVSADKRFMRFDNNIGDVKCADCFIEVSLYDPQFVQREILVMLDGYNMSDFDQYINFASVNMKKVHQNGNIKYDEIRIDHKNFVENANRFKLMYGWDGDENRNEWLNYEYQTTWSFFGDFLVEEEWKTGNANALALGPPLVRRTVRIEADPEMIKEQDIRMIMVKLYYDYGAGEKMEQVILRDNKSLGEVMEFMLPADKYQFEYEVLWHLWDNTRITSARKPSEDQLLFVDVLPESK